MSEIMSRMRVTGEVKYAVSQATNNIYRRFDKLVVRRKNIVNSRTGEWIRPFQIKEIDETVKIVYVQDNTNSPVFPFNVPQLKSYFRQKYSPAHSSLVLLITSDIIKHEVLTKMFL